MGLEPHLTPPVLYSTHFYICTTDAAWSSRGLRQAGTTSIQDMRMLSDAAGSAETEPEERSPVADRRWASTCTTDRDPQTHDQREGGAGPLGASLGRPPPRRVGRTHALDRRQKSLVEPANRLDTHRVEAEAQPESPRARSEQRRFQAALDDREHAGESLRSGRARRPLDCRSATARHAFGPEGGPTGRSSAWLGGWARADASATRLPREEPAGGTRRGAEREERALQGETEPPEPARSGGEGREERRPVRYLVFVPRSPAHIRGGGCHVTTSRKVPSGTTGMCAEAARTSRAGLSRLGSVIWAVRDSVQACAECG